MQVMRTFLKALPRQVAESVAIDRCRADYRLNSKSEWGAAGIPKIRVEVKDKVNLEDWTGERQKKRRLATQTTSGENTAKEMERTPEFRGPFPGAGSKMEEAPEIRSPCPGKVKADTEEEALEHQSPFSGAAKEMKIEGAPEIQGPFPEDDKEVGGAPEIRSPCPVEEGASIEERAPELRGPGPRAANLQEEKIMEASKNNLQADKSQVKPPKPHPNFASYLNGQY